MKTVYLNKDTKEILYTRAQIGFVETFVTPEQLDIIREGTIEDFKRIVEQLINIHNYPPADEENQFFKQDLF